MSGCYKVLVKLQTEELSETGLLGFHADLKIILSFHLKYKCTNQIGEI